MSKYKNDGNKNSSCSVEKAMSKVPNKYGNPVENVKLPTGKMKKK